MPRNGKNRTGTHPGLTRTRYFPRRVVTAADLTADQDYLRERLRRHNRYLHGCGIVCGLEVGAGMISTPPAVTYGPDGKPITSAVALLPGVIVTPGYALSPQGDDIHVPTEQRLFLDNVLSAVDCSNLNAAAPGPLHVWVAVRYREDEIDPIPALPERCASTTRCEPSLFRDDFEVALLKVQPPGCPPLPECADLLAELQRRVPPPGLPPEVPLAAQCPPNATDPWVVLAKVVFEPSVGGADPKFAVDYTPRARRIFSAALLGGILRCLPQQTPVRPAQVVAVEPGRATIFNFPTRPPRIAVIFDKNVVLTDQSLFLEVRTDAGTRRVTGAVSYDALRKTAVFTPSIALMPGFYLIQALGDGAHAVLDSDGLRLDGDSNGQEGGNFSSTFAIVPPVPARVDFVDPPFRHRFILPDRPFSIGAKFDSDLDPATVTDQSFFLLRDGTKVQGTLSYDSHNRLARLTPFSDLPAGDYLIQALGDGPNSIRDPAGQPLDGDDDRRAGGNFQSTFSIVFFSFPTVTPEIEKALRDNGITDAETLAAHDRDDLARLLNLSPEAVDQLQREARQRKEDG